MRRARSAQASSARRTQLVRRLPPRSRCWGSALRTCAVWARWQVRLAVRFLPRSEVA